MFFTYDVVWEKVELRWASRWDIYLKMRNPQIHWFSILNSLVVIVFLSGVLTVILIRTLRRDIAQYNREDIDEVRVISKFPGTGLFLLGSWESFCEPIQ